MTPDASPMDNVKERCDSYLARAKTLLADIKAAKGAKTIENTLMPYNQLSMQLDAGFSLAGLMSQVNPDKKVRDEADACEQTLSKFATDLGLDREVYDAFAAVDSTGMDADTKRYLKKTLQDFRRSGVDKDPETRKRIKLLEEELVVIGQDFGRNIIEDVRSIQVDPAALKGLPEDYVRAHEVKDGKVKITTDYPDFFPFMNYSESNEARKEIRDEFLRRGYPKNESVFQSMLNKRYELAKALGYQNFAEFVVEDKMIKTPKKVEDFINKVSDIAKVGADEDYALLLKEKQKREPDAKKVHAYESGFLSESYKRDVFAFDSQSVRPYFQFERVQDGLLGLTSKLFDIRYEKAHGAWTWDPSVDVYDIYQGSELKGRIFLDLHPRDNKYKHAAQFTLTSGVDGKVLPQGVLVCNFPDPAKTDGPALMEHNQVVTYFHEFGHLLHHIFGGDKQKWVKFSGVATEWDFVEAPSQFFEEFAWDPNVLKKFALHVETNEPIPASLVAKMKEAEEFGKGLSVRRQMFLAALSLNYYNTDPSTFEPLDMLKNLQSKYSYFPYEEGTYFNLNFGHLDGYSAMYYTYMWSKVISKDILSPFKKAGMENEAVAKKYRDTVLKPGGRKDADELIRDFLGRPYQFDAFQEWLTGSPQPAA